MRHRKVLAHFPITEAYTNTLQAIKQKKKRMKNLIILLIITLTTLTIKAQKGDFVNVNGVDIYYETYGEGEPLLLLHGFMVSHKFWEPWIEDFSENYKLIIPDLRGHGNSTNPTNEYTPNISANDMYSLMDSLGIDKFHAMGHSAGAIALLHMSCIDSTRIRNMVIIGGTYHFPVNLRKWLSTIQYETEDPNWLAYLRTHNIKGEEQIKNLLNVLKNQSGVFEGIDLTISDLEIIKSKTLIVHGDNDPAIPVKMAIEMHQNIPESNLWVVPNDGHFPAGLIGKDSIWSQKFVEILKSFLGEN